MKTMILLLSIFSFTSLTQAHIKDSSCRLMASEFSVDTEFEIPVNSNRTLRDLLPGTTIRVQNYEGDTSIVFVEQDLNLQLPEESTGALNFRINGKQIAILCGPAILR